MSMKRMSKQVDGGNGGGGEGGGRGGDVMKEGSMKMEEEAR